MDTVSRFVSNVEFSFRNEVGWDTEMKEVTRVILWALRLCLCSHRNHLDDTKRLSVELGLLVNDVICTVGKSLDEAYDLIDDTNVTHEMVTTAVVRTFVHDKLTAIIIGTAHKLADVDPGLSDEIYLSFQ